MSVVRGWLGVLAMLCVGCGAARGSVSAPKASSPFLESDKPLFEDGVDLIGDPEGLSGRWAEDWARELHERVERSDVIALVVVNTLSTDVSPEQSSTYRLVAELGDVLKGKYEGELVLASGDESIGFDSVDRERGNILKRPLIAFVKWAGDDAGLVRPRWHLSAGTKTIVNAVRLEIAGERPNSQAVLEHSH